VSPEISVTDDSAADRYVIDADGRRVGFLTYDLRPGQIALLHAEIDPAIERRGLGSKLVAHALADARARGLEVLPYCPFVRAYMAEHAEYRDLIPAQGRSRFGF
jgi:hypothetical protein